MDQQVGSGSLCFAKAPFIIGTASVVGTKEGEGPLADAFDCIGPDDKFGQQTWEAACCTAYLSCPAPDEQALCNAMTAGDRRSLSPALRAAYSRSGTSHLLAVSGLHVGIVFLLANLLLWWLPLVRHGHILRNIAVILLIWLYAAVTGFPPSVVRAALMFSVLQFALASSSEYVGMNTLAGVAFVMLLLAIRN